MGSSFMQQFMQGWQMGQQRNENTRRDEYLRMQQQEEAWRQQQEEQDRALRLENYKLQKQELDLRMKKERFDAAQQAAAMQSRYAVPAQVEDLGGATPEAPSAGVLQMAPYGERAPITAEIPGAPEGTPSVELPFYEDIQAREAAESQRKMREALGMKRAELETEEPYRISDDKRAADLAAQRDAAAERRYQTRLDTDTAKRKGNATKLRTEYNQQMKPYLQEIDQFNKAKSLASIPDEARTPADDIALVFLFMKAQDPGSTVREGEYATAKNAAGVPERVRNAYNSTLKGTFLSPEQRRAFATSIERNFMAGPGARVESIQKRYDFLARDAGIDPELVLMESGVLGGEKPPEESWQTVAGVRVRRKVR